MMMIMMQKYYFHVKKGVSFTWPKKNFGLNHDSDESDDANAPRKVNNFCLEHRWFNLNKIISVDFVSVTNVSQRLR